MPKNVQTTIQLCSFHMLARLCSESFNLVSLQHYMNYEHPDFQAKPRRDRGARGKISNIRCIIEKAREFQKNIYSCFIEYAKAFDWITTNCGKFFRGWEFQTTCLLRNLYVGQEATVRTGHGTMELLKIRKEVCQGFILLPCLFKFYAKYIMKKSGLGES